MRKKTTVEVVSGMSTTHPASEGREGLGAKEGKRYQTSFEKFM